jgi:hypothetical protein
MNARVSSNAWVLNLDADLELAAAASGERYAPTHVVVGAMKPHLAKLAASLLGPDDLIVDATTEPGAARGRMGRAFCPTARAIALLESAGAVPAPHPSQEVLREVNGRAFCAALGQTLPGATFARDLDAAMQALAQEPPPVIAREWRVKRAFGMAGRGQRVIVPRAANDGDISFLRAGMREGGVQIEPHVTIQRELSIHGFAFEDGASELGQLVEQRCDAHGQWLATERVASSSGGVDAKAKEAILQEAKHLATALHAAGYFGPFGVDAFLYRGLDGVVRTQPRSEINARYSMGFGVGFGVGVHR